MHYNYFNEYYKMIAVNLSKQQAIDADPKAIEQINFTGNLAWDGNWTICKSFANGSSANIELSKLKLSCIKKDNQKI